MGAAAIPILGLALGAGQLGYNIWNNQNQQTAAQQQQQSYWRNQQEAARQNYVYQQNLMNQQQAIANADKTPATFSPTIMRNTGTSFNSGLSSISPILQALNNQSQGYSMPNLSSMYGGMNPMSSPIVQILNSFMS